MKDSIAASLTFSVRQSYGCQTRQKFHAADFLHYDVKPLGGQAICLTIARGLGLAESLNPAILQQSADSAVEGPGAHADAVSRYFLHVLEDRVPVTRLRGQAQENEEDWLGERLVMSRSDMSHGSILASFAGKVKAGHRPESM